MINPLSNASAQAYLNSQRTWVEVENLYTGAFFHPSMAFKGTPNHTASSKVWFDVKRLLVTHGKHLIHSSFHNMRCGGKRVRFYGQNYIFKLEEDVVAQLSSPAGDGHQTLTVWSSNAMSAENLIRSWIQLYQRRSRKKSSGFHFYLLEMRNGEIAAHLVNGFKPFALRENDLALHYGLDFPSWEEEFVVKLKREMTGAAIFMGSPGTGKTSFIRHLIHRLRHTHRFYYVPVRDYALISNPSLASFWVEQQHQNPNMKMAVILEDAESILAVRGPDNAANVSNLLNMADGLLGEFLKLQLICTINCKVDQLDPAILRQGRLLSLREFRRLTPHEAGMLAQAKGLCLSSQNDYSVAEIYHSSKSEAETARPPDRRIGFAAAA